MEVAFIAPLSLLDTQEDQKYQLMLPQLFYELKYQKAYHKFAMKESNFTILDNGAAEDSQVTDQELLQIALEMRVNELAAPDTLGDAKETLMKVDVFFSRNLGMIEVLQQRCNTQLGFVAQGKDVEEALALVHAVMRSRWESYLSTVYLPRLLVVNRSHRHERIKLAEYIHGHFGKRLNIHLFGSAPSYVQEVRMAAMDTPYIRSVDTSLPYNLAFNQASIIQSPSIWDQDRGLPGKRPANYFDQPKKSFDKELLEFNMKTFKRWANG